jgi:formylglycine-generating enzyme required for sulfatase activity
MHPVGGKLPNMWGLHDMLGNAFEFIHDVDRGRSPEPMQTDPFGEVGTHQDSRAHLGGSTIGWPSLLRIASGLQSSNTASALVGFRLARTLGKGTLPTIDEVPDEYRRGWDRPQAPE